MDAQTIRALLEEFTRARNNLRSCEADARGFVSGRRIYNLRDARARHAAALLALSPWIEAQAREAITKAEGGA